MVLFIDIIRKFSFKSFSQYLNEIAKGVVKEFVKGLPDAVDDDLRGLAALSNERIGHADNLTHGMLVPRSQMAKVIYEGGQNELALWLYGNDVNSPEWQDMSGWGGVVLKHIDFDGVDENINCGNDATLWSQSLTKFSFSFWIYPENDSGFHQYVHHGGGGTSNGFECFQDGTDIGFEINFGAGGLQVSGSMGASGTFRRWRHIVCVFDSTLGSNEMKIYLDGVLLAQGQTGGAINLSVDLLLGSTVANSIDGQLKDFRWFGPNTALSAADVAAIYKLSPVPTPNYWLKLTDTGSGNPVDAISGTKVGTLGGGAAWGTRDYTKIIKRVGNPCVVKTTQDFIARKEVGYFDGISDGGYVENNFELQLDHMGKGISMSGWFYVPTGADAIGEYLDTNCVYLNGVITADVSTQINLGNDGLWDQALAKFSFSIWVNLKNLPTGGIDRYVVNHGGASNHAFRLLIDGATNKFKFLIKNSGGSNLIVEANAAAVTNTWYHIVCSYDNSLGSDNMKLFINNVLQTDKADLTEAINLTAILQIGDDDEPIDGFVKDFIFDFGGAFGSFEVNNYFNGTEYLNSFRSDARYLMREGTGDAVDDFEDGRDGLLQNGAKWADSVDKPTPAYSHKIKMPKPIYLKIDGDTNYNILFLEPTDKSLVWEIKDSSNVMIRKIDNAYAFNTWVFWAVKYDPTGPTFTMYKDGTSQSVTTPLINYPTVPQGVDRTDAFLFRGGDFNDVFTNIAFYNLKYWRNRLLTNIEVYNESVNKFSISNITAAERPIVGYMSLANLDSDNPFAGAPTGPTFRRTGVYQANDNIVADGILNDAIVSVGSDAEIQSGVEGKGQQFATGAVAGNNAGIRQTSSQFNRQWTAYMIARVRPSTNSNIGMFVGFTSQNADFANATILDNFSGVGVGKRASDTNLQVIRNDGDATTDYVDTGIPFPSNVGITIELLLNPTDFRAVIDGVLQTPQTTEIPALTDNLRMQCEAETSDGVSKNFDIFSIFVKSGP